MIKGERSNEREDVIEDIDIENSKEPEMREEG